MKGATIGAAFLLHDVAMRRWRRFAALPHLSGTHARARGARCLYGPSRPLAGACQGSSTPATWPGPPARPCHVKERAGLDAAHGCKAAPGVARTGWGVVRRGLAPGVEGVETHAGRLRSHRHFHPLCALASGVYVAQRIGGVLGAVVARAGRHFAPFAAGPCASQRASARRVLKRNLRPPFSSANPPQPSGRTSVTPAA